MTTQTAFAGAILATTLAVVLLVGVFSVLILARAAQAWGVAIGQAQQLSLVGVATRDEIDQRRAAGEPDDDAPNAEARPSLLDASPDDFVAAARRNADRAGRRRTQEWNANDNASADYVEPETAFDGPPPADLDRATP